jgi:parvulin-like peptidyl-prolyl cis-trans isomerase-like protein
MKKLMREPLAHFLLLGAAIFTAYSLVSKSASDAPGKIVITHGQIASMVEAFTLTWQRPPTGDEVRGLLRDRVREEIYYREAMALGLDKDDTVIRRRLRQKMEFVTDDVGVRAQPTDDELNAYLQMHPDKFRIEQEFTFRQVYLDPKKHGESLARDTAQLLAKLNQTADADFAAMGDPFLLDNSFTGVRVSEVAKQFGEKFATNLVRLSPGQWQGPVESAYGVHLVLVSDRTKGGAPALADVREAVQREWNNATRLKANEAYYGELLKRYTVTIEQPAAEGAAKIATTKQK